MNTMLAGLGMLGAAVLGGMGAVPQELWNAISNNRSSAVALATRADDCDAAYQALDTSYRLLLRANARARTDSEKERVSKFVKKLDIAAETLDSICG